ncbi:MAG: HlyD family secretion protein, partial [Desulfurella sp.]
VKDIDAGTGDRFSLLPPQNASGNYIKIVQRVPVRIELYPYNYKKYPLRVGLNCEVTVHVK